jgi:hypothetical protein
MIVADSSPLIALARIGQLDLLHEIYEAVVIPPAVEDEIERHPRGFEGSRPPWIRLHWIENPSTVASFRNHLHRGESEVLALGVQLQLPVLLDEADGRRVAFAAGLAVVGTLGVLILAKRQGMLERVDPEIARLHAEGFRIGPGLIAEALRLAGEA